MNQEALVRALRTAVQTAIGLAMGLVTAVWAVPGVPEVVTNYLYSNLVPVLVLVGVPAGVAAYIWNVARPR